MTRELPFRERIITELLERHTELTDPMQARNKTGDGEPIPLMPGTYTPTVQELERLLALLQHERRTQWWHVTARYIECVYTTKNIPVKRKGKNGKTLTVIERRVVPSYHPGVRLEKVRRGITWIAGNWARGPDAKTRAEPELPKELRIAA